MEDKFKEMEIKCKDMFISEMDNKFKKVVKELEEVKKSISFMSDHVDQLTAENKQLKMDIEIIKKQQQQAIKTIEDNKKKLNENAERLNAMDNHMRFNNLEIHGVPCKENENINDVALKILKAVDTSIKTEDIQTVYRRKDSYNKPGIIITKMKTREKRIDIFRRKKNLAGFNFSNIGLDTAKVYINENLCASTKSLFYKANQLKKSNNWKSIWTYNGNIKLIKNDQSQIITISNENDLSQIN